MKIALFIIGLVALAVAGAWAAPKAVELGTPTALASDCTPTEDGWQRYSWTGGPHEGDDPPAFPSEDWQANVAGDPHGIGVEGAYFVSHGGSGLGDWFYLELVPGHDCPPVDTTTGGTTTEPDCDDTLANQMLVCNPCPDDPELDADDPRCGPRPPHDVCLNLGGVQATVPIGYVMGTDGACSAKSDDPPKRHRHDPPGTTVGDCVVQTNRELLCGEQG